MLQDAVKEIKVALFDMDGLLIDSEKVYCACWIQAARELGYSLDEERVLTLRSLDKTLANELFVGWFSDRTAYERVKTRRKEIMAAKIRQTRGIKSAVVTASPQKRAQMHLESVGLNGLFETIITTEDVKKGKPFPDVYLYAAGKLGVKPEDCLAFEDSPNGVKSAYEAGCRTVMIPDLTPAAEELMPYVDYVYGSLADLAVELQQGLPER